MRLVPCSALAIQLLHWPWAPKLAEGHGVRAYSIVLAAALLAASLLGQEPVVAATADVLPSSILSSSSRQRNVGTLATYFIHTIPLVIVGEGWSQQFVVTCVDASRGCAFTVSFWDRDGNSWPVDIVGITKSAVYQVTLQSGQTTVFETPVTFGAQALGWALLMGGVGGPGDFLAQTIWRKQTVGRPDLMTSAIASAPSLSPAKTTIFFDSRDGKYAGVMVLFADYCIAGCSSSQPVAFRGRAYENSGKLLAERTYQLRLGALHWFCLECDIPEVVGKVGTFVVEPISYGNNTTTPVLATFSLQFAPNGAFTAITGFEH